MFQDTSSYDPLKSIVMLPMEKILTVAFTEEASEIKWKECRKTFVVWYLTYIHTRYPFNNTVCSDDTGKRKSGSLERIIVKLCIMSC